MDSAPRSVVTTALGAPDDEDDASRCSRASLAPCSVVVPPAAARAASDARLLWLACKTTPEDDDPAGSWRIVPQPGAKFVLRVRSCDDVVARVQIWADPNGTWRANAQQARALTAAAGGEPSPADAAGAAAPLKFSSLAALVSTLLRGTLSRTAALHPMLHWVPPQHTGFALQAANDAVQTSLDESSRGVRGTVARVAPFALPRVALRLLTLPSEAEQRPLLFGIHFDTNVAFCLSHSSAHAYVSSDLGAAMEAALARDGVMA
jgi:hypothetical protein